MGLPRVLKRFNIFMDGANYVGETEEITLPTLKRKMEEHRSGGMPGPIKIDLGQDAIELEWKAAGFIVEQYKAYGAVKHDKVLVRFAGGIQADDSEDVQSIEVTVRGRAEEINPGSAKAGDKTQQTMKMACSYYKLVVDGETIIEIDMVNMIEIINGEDRAAKWRSALGI